MYFRENKKTYRLLGTQVRQLEEASRLFPANTTVDLRDNVLHVRHDKGFYEFKVKTVDTSEQVAPKRAKRLGDVTGHQGHFKFTSLAGCVRFERVAENKTDYLTLAYDFKGLVARLCGGTPSAEYELKDLRALRLVTKAACDEGLTEVVVGIGADSLMVNGCCIDADGSGIEPVSMLHHCDTLYETVRYLAVGREATLRLYQATKTMVIEQGNKGAILRYEQA
jgi:hypothetical protein